MKKESRSTIAVVIRKNPRPENEKVKTWAAQLGTDNLSMRIDILFRQQMQNDRHHLINDK